MLFRPCEEELGANRKKSMFAHDTKLKLREQAEQNGAPQVEKRPKLIVIAVSAYFMR